MITSSRNACRHVFLSGICCVLLAPPGTGPAAGAEKVLHAFQGGEDGSGPGGLLIRDNAGNLYGTTSVGGGGTDCYEGSYGCGTIYRLAPHRTETVLHAFAGGCDGANPFAGLVADKAGNMYGTTNSGGTCNNDDGFGTVYKLAPDGSETVLYAFKGGRDGSDPVGSLILGKNGRLYGASEFGGDMAGCGGGGCGTVFEVVPKGKESVLHAFESGGDGAEPVGGVIMDKAGNLYGTTSRGGGTGCSGDGCGTVFELAPDGTETILHAFQGGSDGELPQNGVVEDSAGNLYGTTGAGGTGAVGTVFEVTPDGAETVLYSFQPGPGGAIPTSVILDKAGNLYGTTYYGGSTGCKGAGCGVVYELAPDGTETVLNVFDKSRFGRVPSGGLLLGKHGDLYGTTGGGGDDDNGVVFELKN